MNCINCGNSLKTGKKFCSSKCQGQYIIKSKIDDWFSGKISGNKKGLRIISAIRNYLLEKNDNKCSKCGWGKVNPYSRESSFRN